MGAQVCGRGPDVVHSVLAPTEVPNWNGDHGASHSSSEQPSLEVAHMLAAERALRQYESTARVAALFDLRDPGTHDPPETYVAVHRTTGMVRRVVSVRKPGGAEKQERLRVVVGQLQRLRCDTVASVLEVFEDCRSLALVTEHCSGGTVYDRILQRQYFAEQESAVLVRHLLHSLASLHRCGLAHGSPSPDAFRFQSEQPHASLKLVDYGLELRAHLWDAQSCASAGSRAGSRRTACLQFCETCRVVFCAPEVLRPLQQQGRAGRRLAAGAPECAEEVTAHGLLAHGPALAEAVEAHLEELEGPGGRPGSLEAADAWGVGAVAFLLLCGYPPFFAPCRYAILARIEKTDFSFDPPFWSKISEEAKDFVQRCLRAAPGRRLAVLDALQHPWIQNLAETSPSGSMLSSFALNLRRFYRTSLIEAFTAKSLAVKLSHGEAREVGVRCREADQAKTGFLTATDLRELLSRLGHVEIADAVGMCFSHALRHPGEAYIDYQVLLESVRLRRERLVEEELWRCFREFDGGGPAERGRLRLSRLPSFLQDAQVRKLLAQDGVECSSVRAPSAATGGGASAGAGADAGGGADVEPEVDFVELAAEVLRRLPQAAAASPGRPGGPGVRGDASRSGAAERAKHPG